MIKRSIKGFIATDEHPMVVLVDENRIPLFYPNIYATIKYRSLGRTASTTEKILRCIGVAHLWASLNDIELEQKIITSDFLTIEQLQDLAFFLRLTSPKQKELAQKNNSYPLTSTRKISKMVENLIYMPSTHEETNTSISAEEAAYRIKTISKYFKFLLQRANHRTQQEKIHNIEQRLDYFKTLAPKVNNSGDADAPEGLSINERKILINLIEPEHPENPFRNTFLKHRNQLIYEILLTTGIRRIELRHIKIDDVDYLKHTIRIRVSKTKPREVVCSSKVCELFHRYCTTQLNQIPIKQRKHGYLFTTQKGEHLSNDAINLVFRALSTAAKISTNLTPHTLRRTWNDVLSETIDQLPPKQRPSFDKEKKIRNRLMGWSEISEMSSTYARRSIREKADEIANLLADNIISTRSSNYEI